MLVKAAPPHAILISFTTARADTDVKVGSPSRLLEVDSPLRCIDPRCSRDEYRGDGNPLYLSS